MESGARTTQIPVRVAAVWGPMAPQDEYGFYDLRTAFEDVLFVPRGTYTGRLSRYVEGEVYLGLWHLVMDSSTVHAATQFCC